MHNLFTRKTETESYNSANIVLYDSFSQQIDSIIFMTMTIQKQYKNTRGREKGSRRNWQRDLFMFTKIFSQRPRQNGMRIEKYRH